MNLKPTHGGLGKMDISITERLSLSLFYLYIHISKEVLYIHCTTDLLNTYRWFCFIKPITFDRVGFNLVLRLDRY